MSSSFLRPRDAALVALVVATGLAWSSPTERQQPQPISLPVPRTVGSWRGTPMEVDQRAREILETDAVTLMDYRAGNSEPSVWLARVEGVGTRAAFHPPELCYIGSHFEVVERAPVTVTVDGTRHRVMRLVIRQADQRFEAWYWFTANGRVTPSYYQQQLWLLTDTMRGRAASGSLVRISTPLDNSTRAHRRLQDFLASLLSAPSGGTNG